MDRDGEPPEASSSKQQEAERAEVDREQEAEKTDWTGSSKDWREGTGVLTADAKSPEKGASLKTEGGPDREAWEAWEASVLKVLVFLEPLGTLELGSSCTFPDRHRQYY